MTALSDMQRAPFKFVQHVSELVSSECVLLCVFITAVPITKLFAREGGGEVEDICYERLQAEAYVN